MNVAGTGPGPENANHVRELLNLDVNFSTLKGENGIVSRIKYIEAKYISPLPRNSEVFEAGQAGFGELLTGTEI